MGVEEKKKGIRLELMILSSLRRFIHAFHSHLSLPFNSGARKGREKEKRKRVRENVKREFFKRKNININFLATQFFFSLCFFLFYVLFLPLSLVSCGLNQQ